jgi:hypothetical protein
MRNLVPLKYAIYTIITTGLAALNLSAAPNLTGEWVTTFGRYEEILTLKADGTYTRVSNVVRGPEELQKEHAKTVGKWKFDGGELELTSKLGTEKEKIKIVSVNEFEYPSVLGQNNVLNYERSEPIQDAKNVAKGKITEPKIGSPERKAIMDAMRGPVSKYAKTEVIFTGTVSVYEDWAKLTGHVNPKNGKPFAEEVADELECDFLAILQKVDGKWNTRYYGWSGDIGTRIEAREKLPNIPEVLLPKIPH